MHTQYIDSNEKLKELCQSLTAASEIFLDTEFIRQTTYYPILALIQVTDGKQLAIIDPLTIDDLSPFFELCQNNHVLKVFHSGKQDLEIIYLLSGQAVTPVFDTQIAAALLGYGTQIGYANLVEVMLELSLDKSQTCTDWLQRPLTEEQKIYAVNDVIYLEKIFRKQYRQLTQSNRLEWLANDFAQLSSVENFEIDTMNLWKKIKGHTKLKKHQLVILQSLADLRETLARKNNKPRRNIIGDQALLNLALKKPGNKQEFYQTYGISSSQVSSDTALQMIETIDKASHIPEGQHPKNQFHIQLTAQQSAITDCLMAICHLCADKNSITTSYLCHRKDLEKLTMGTNNITLMQGWRYELAGKHLEAFIQGRSKLSIENNQLQIT